MCVAIFNIWFRCIYIGQSKSARRWPFRYGFQANTCVDVLSTRQHTVLTSYHAVTPNSYYACIYVFHHCCGARLILTMAIYILKRKSKIWTTTLWWNSFTDTFSHARRMMPEVRLWEWRIHWICTMKRLETCLTIYDKWNNSFGDICNSNLVNECASECWHYVYW